MYLAPIALSLLTLTLLAPAPVDRTAEILAFPVPSEPLEIPGGIGREGYSVWDMLQAYSSATGQHVIANEEALEYCQRTRLNLASAMTVPPDRVQTVVESLLAQNDFVLSVVHAATPRVLAVTSLYSGARFHVRESAVPVPPDRLELMRAHPGMLFTTTLNLPKTDVRQLCNSIRTLITDADTQQILPAGDTNSIVLTGYGATIADLVGLLESIDEASVFPLPTPPTAATTTHE